MTAPNLWDYVPAAPADATFQQLVAIAIELEKRHTEKFGPLYGVIIGEVVFEAEQNRGLRVGGKAMENKILEQRQTSWLPRIMRAANLVTTQRVRRSPVGRHHGNRHTVWVRREVSP